MKDALRPASLGAAPPPRWPRSRSATGSFYREARSKIATTFNYVATHKTGDVSSKRFAGARIRASVASLMLGDIFT